MFISFLVNSFDIKLLCGFFFLLIFLNPALWSWGGHFTPLFISEHFLFSLPLFSFCFLNKIKTYNPLLQLFPEDFELLELQHSSVVHLVQTSRKKMWHCGCFQAPFITTVLIPSNDSILFYSECVESVWKDTSIRLMMLWQVASVNPSNLISFPGGQKSKRTRNQQKNHLSQSDWEANKKQGGLKRGDELTSAEDTVQHLLELPGGDGLVLWRQQEML